MKLNVLKTINLIALVSIMAVSCADDFPYRNDPIPEGDGTLSATVTFTPITASSLGTTRTPGNAIQNIESLCVLVYGKDEKLIKKYSSLSDDPSNKLNNYNVKKYNEDGAYEVDKNKDIPKDVEGAHTDETRTAQATFSLPDLPYGQYYIYAVANMGDLSDYETEIQTVEGLQNIKLTWKPENIGLNNQMFGYFTSADDMESKGFKPEKPITFTNRPKDSKIHAWLKRAASKVTVAFDPSGLNQGVTIYIRNVTVRDIPKTCLLGAENTPASADELYNHLASYENPDYEKNPTTAVANSRLEYNAQGVITDEGHTGSSNTDGLRLDNSIRGTWPEGAHNMDAPSLFFYENDQNAWLEKQTDFKDGDGKKNDRYNKQPQRTGPDEVGSTIHDPSDDKDFKDRVPYGTYVEVEAYYTSSNPANPGEGTIKYRFMLGKDTSFDYDAQRNYHFKLTLGFKGWANDPDWHIDYVITTPSIEVPSVFRVSYLYQQKSELPIKIVGDIQNLTVLITENNWAPYDPNTSADPNNPAAPITGQIITLGGKEYKVPKQTIESDPTVYQFQWNEAAFRNSVYSNPAPTGNEYPDNLPQGQQRPQFGFLALHLPSRNTTTITTEFSAGANAELINYWKNNLEGERRFNEENGDFKIDDGQNSTWHDTSWGDRNHSFPAEDNKYEVKRILNDNGVPLDNQRILMLPVWTRTKTLIQTSGFSGNNPYEAFERKATLEIRASFKDYPYNPIVKTVEVYQVKRITNPKGVWRAYDRNDRFNVTLLEPINSNAESDFQAFTSQGEWTAFIDEQTNEGGFKLLPNAQTNGYIKDGKIYGNTGSEIHFAIDFGNTVKEDESQCAVVKVLYHGNQCMHKILVRKGYNAPLRMGNNPYRTSTGVTVKGRLWSSYSLYQATKTGGTPQNNNEIFDAVLTKNPLMLGSMFRRGRQDQGIFVWNNMQTDLGVFVQPRNNPFVIGAKEDGVTIDPDATGNKWKNQWEEATWNGIGYRDDRQSGGNLQGSNYVNGSRAYGLGTFKTEDNTYQVPTVDEFQDLTENSEFGFGVFYGSEATEPKLKSEEAYGLIDPYNEGLFNIKNGMRAVVAYDKSTGNQILFPLGRYGIGVRRMFNRNLANNSWWGNLHYSDVYSPLVNASDNNNLYRPIPYNLPIVSGCIYWVDKYVAAGTYNNSNGNYTLSAPCLGWDMNYFNFDFNPYTANNWADACQIKFVIVE
ncbi:MAG: hypothetical protein K2N48_00055 [Muribaculaceae bacterium]|nr:hypothetical protein [Muribaculaceae bacterium]